MKTTKERKVFTMCEEPKKELSLPRRYRRMMFSIILIVVALLSVAFITFFISYTSTSKKYDAIIKELEEKNKKLSDPIVKHEIASKEVSIDLINSDIQTIGELATIEYLYTDAAKFEDPKQLFGVDVPFTTKSFIVKWDGSIKAGVNISKVTAEIDKIKKVITVYIPNAEILSHEIHSDSIETLDEKNGLFNKITIDDVREFDKISKEAMEQRAIENGILDKSFENAKTIIYKLVNTDVVKELEYTISFETINK